MGPWCVLRGVATHNLRSVDVEFPLGQFTVVTGVSGSGKSSLVFDSLYAESYRRYLESLSSYARQYLQVLAKPRLDGVENLPAAIAVRQARGGLGRRSTVGTLTEINDLLQVLFEVVGTVVCPHCGASLQAAQPGALARQWAEAVRGPVWVLAPVAHWHELSPADLTGWLLGQGFSRYRAPDGTVSPLETMTAGRDFYRGHLVVDRIEVRSSRRLRLEQALRQALSLGRGVCAVEELAAAPHLVAYASEPTCFACDKSVPPPRPSRFSFNHPHGACPECQGYGRALAIDWDKVFPDLDQSLQGGAIRPFEFSNHARFGHQVEEAARRKRIPVTRPLGKWTPAQWAWLKQGDGEDFHGVAGYFAWLDSKKHIPHYRMHRMRFSRYVTCPSCQGQRLAPEVRAYRLAGETYPQWQALPLGELASRLAALVADLPALETVRDAMDELKARLGYLNAVGLGYLTAARDSVTLSGGELQRIHLARCLGSGLHQTLICLDEPSTGLHPVDRDALLAQVHELVGRDNTVVAVEHDAAFIAAADYLVRIGPRAGAQGGEVVYRGAPPAPAACGRPQQPRRRIDRDWPDWVVLAGASVHNLQGVTVELPLGCHVGVCGVSGSGKSSLILHSLVPVWERLGVAQQGPDPEIAVRGSVVFRGRGAAAQVLHVSQQPMTRNQRSNVATTCGVYDRIRKHFARTEAAQNLSLTPGSFSFNSPGGRCESCAGLGEVEEELSFLGTVASICGECGGKRFQPAVLGVRLGESNIADVLGMTVDQASEFFAFDPAIVRELGVVASLGLGYLPLGRPTSTLSGGECQRLKLVQPLRQTLPQATCFVFDEPTSGLSDEDVAVFLEVTETLIAAGHSVITVEHHLGLLAQLDYLIELGPGAGRDGGKLIYAGPPQEIVGCAQSRTGPYLGG